MNEQKSETSEKRTLPASSFRGLILLVSALFVVIVAVVVWSIRSPGKTGADQGVWIPGTTPGPWQYDPQGNQHWNPEPGHNHWHSGPPPSAGSSNPNPGPPSTSSFNLDQNSPFQQFKPALETKNLPANPKPWQFDQASNQHFDPRPGHQHWHQGPPPPEDQRK